jgi:hypothetical protein
MHLETDDEVIGLPDRKFRSPKARIAADKVA